jgi:hypothetical protein
MADERNINKNERLSLPVERTIESLVSAKDANENYQITRDVYGPKVNESPTCLPRNPLIESCS